MSAGSLVTSICARLVEITLGHRAKQRLRRGPDRFDERQLLGRVVAVLQLSGCGVPGQSFMKAMASAAVMPSTAHQPIEPAAVLTAAKTVKMIADRLRTMARRRRGTGSDLVVRV